MQILLAEWVSPFGHPRIKVCCRLPEAFRRLPRPSSPLTAKASTVCACSLDPITPKRLRVLEASNKPHSFRLLASTTHSEASLSTPSLARSHGGEPQTLVTSHLVKERGLDFSVQPLNHLDRSITPFRDPSIQVFLSDLACVPENVVSD